jgi:exodeoxyribonuclease-3
MCGCGPTCGWDALREVVGAGPDAVVVCGDMNIAPADAGVFDPDAYIG